MVLRLATLVLSFMIGVFLLIGSAKAQPTGTEPIENLHVQPQELGPVTEEFDIFQFSDNTRTTTDATSMSELGVGTTYIDEGHAVLDYLVNDGQYLSTGESAYLHNEWDFIGLWSIEGVVTNSFSVPTGTYYEVSYTEGYITAAVSEPGANLGSSPDITDDYFIDARPVLDAFLVPEYSSGTIIFDDNTDQLFRNSSIVFKVTYLDPVFFPPDLVDAYYQGTEVYVVATESAASGLSHSGTNSDGYVYFVAPGTASVSLYKAIPEPASIMLLGIGIMGVGKMLAKKK